MNHREIQSAHEQSVLQSFHTFLDEQGIRLSVINRPDPPDAIVKIDDHVCWIEITDAFQSPDWAKCLKSYAAGRNDHDPSQSRHLYLPDCAACKKIEEVILKKYERSSMQNLLKQFGQGILLVGAYTPSTSPETIIEQAGEAIMAEVARKAAIFKSIYLYRSTSTGHAFTKLF